MSKLVQTQTDVRRQKQVAEALQKIRVYHEISLALLEEKQLPVRLKELYESLNPDTQAKIRRFANIDNGGYSKTQLTSLLQLCVKHDYPLGFKLVERLMSIPMKSRVAIQNQMVKEKWSRESLDNHISLRPKSKNWKAGRPPKKLPRPEVVIPFLRNTSIAWAKRARSIASEYPEVVKDLPSRVRKTFSDATTIMESLNKSLDALLEKVGKAARR